MKTITGKLVNRGFNEAVVLSQKALDTEAYILGANSKLPTTIYRPDGQWSEVVYEPQAKDYETWGCTVWNGQSQIEIFTKDVYGYEPNYDERFNYLKADIQVGGASPKDAYESFRNDGLIDNEPLPPTFKEFTNKDYLTRERINRGQNWISREFEFKHDWLPDTNKNTIIGTLSMSPVCVAVTAWFRDGGGFYVDSGQNNTHWTVARGYVRKEEVLDKVQLDALAKLYEVSAEALYDMVINKGEHVLKIFDSYDNANKLLHPEHRISVAKRIYLRKRQPGEVAPKKGWFCRTFGILC